MTKNIIKTVLLVVACVAIVAVGLYLRKMIWESNLPEWFRIWSITH